MTIVAGVDFGTLSVRVTLVDSEKGPIGTASASYALHRRREDPDFATQSHAEQMDALVKATREALSTTRVDGGSVAAIALDTTGSSVVPVGEGLEPLDEYYLWCDHRAHAEAEEITAKAHAMGLEAIDWCGGVYSHEWGFAKLLHWLRHNPEKRKQFVTALEHCDMVAATLSRIRSANQLKRSVCAMGHKWMWNPKWDGLPPEEFLVAVDPLFAGVRAKMGGDYRTSDRVAGHLSPEWAREAWTARRNPDSCRCVRRTLGRDWLEYSRGRCGERGGDFHMHHRDGAGDATGSRSLRRRAWKCASGLHGDRSWPLGNGRYF